ncbi:MAG: MarR family winged helix-turn-helix transcriptional regulator [Microbacteriaceae bacterium]
MSDNKGSTVFSDEELTTWSAFATVLEWLPAALDTSLQRESDLTHFEYGVLFALADSPQNGLRMAVLASYANSTLSRLSRAVSRLEGKGWVLRKPDTDDGRSTLAVLTDSGIEKLRSSSPGHVRTVRRLVLDPLTETQARQLHTISQRIMRAIRDEDGWKPAPVAGRE